MCCLFAVYTITNRYYGIRLYNIGCVFTSGLIITIPLLLESFGLKVTSDFTNSPDSKNYHARGITVCKEWASDFMAFHKWALDNGYNDSLSLDRIDNNKGYSPHNCQWIPIEKQQSNKSNTVYVTYHGEKYCLRTLCLEIGFPYKTAHCRLSRMRKKGIEIDTEKLFAPVQKNKTAFRFRDGL